MPETLEQVLIKLEIMKHEDGVDELIQHFFWTILGIFVTLDQIRKGPDKLLTLLIARINGHVAPPSIAPGSVRPEDPHASREA
jgi:hypothetical protein